MPRDRAIILPGCKICNSSDLVPGLQYCGYHKGDAPAAKSPKKAPPGSIKSGKATPKKATPVKKATPATKATPVKKASPAKKVTSNKKKAEPSKEEPPKKKKKSDAAEAFSEVNAAMAVLQGKVAALEKLL